MKEGRLYEKESPSGRSQFQFKYKKQRIRKEVPFPGRLFSWGKYMVNISLEQCFFKKHLYKPHKTRYNAVKTKKNNI